MRFVAIPIAVVLLGVLIYAGVGSNPLADDVTVQRDGEGMLPPSGDTVLETETELDETLRVETVTDPDEVDIATNEMPEPSEPVNAGDVLTVEGYDPVMARYLLQESDLELELRNELINELQMAYDADDSNDLGAVLARVRQELAE